MDNENKDLFEKLKNYSKNLKRSKSKFDDFPRYVIKGDRTRPAATVLKVYLSKTNMISVHRENNGNGFVFVNYSTRATLLKNLNPSEMVVTEDEWFAALAEKIFY